jgi:hypothetical protein
MTELEMGLLTLFLSLSVVAIAAYSSHLKGKKYVEENMRRFEANQRR